MLLDGIGISRGQIRDELAELGVVLEDSLKVLAGS